MLTRIYATLLHLYPRRFRDEFADEMLQVFIDTIADAAQRGNIVLIQTCLQELRDLPRAILREYWRTRSISMESQTRVSWLELLITAIPFLLYLALPIVEGIPITGGIVVILLLLGVVIILMIAGLFKGMPRWSLPALGVLLSVLNLIIFAPMVEVLNSVPPPFLRAFFDSGFPYIGIIVLTLIVILATATIQPWRPFFQRIRDDWTLLPFALSGIMPLVMLISFDEYQGDVPYQISMGAILLASLWLYLRSTQPWRKLSVLGIGISVAMAIEAIGKWILVPSQQWRDSFARYTIEQTAQREVISTVYTWFWVMVIVFLPALLGILSRSTRLTPATQP